MRRLRFGWPVVAGACAAALTVSVAACSPVTTKASAPFPTIFPGTAIATPRTAGTQPTQATTAQASTARPTRAHAVRIETGPAVRTSRGSIRAARLLRSALADPDAIAAAGSDVWVANSGGASGTESGGRGWVSEFSATSGALIRVIGGPQYGLADPQALAVDGDDVWVADGNGGSVTEINAGKGALTRVVAGPQYQFADPGAIAVAGADLWVANGGSDSVTEINTATGALIRVISAQRYGLSTTVYSPAIAAAGGHVWVSDGASNSVTEINAATGALTRVISGPQYRLNGPDAITAAGDDVWVIDVNSGSVTEINAATGGLVRVIGSVTNVPFAITADRAGVWLMTNLGVKAVDGTGPDGAVDEFSAAPGRPMTRIAAAPFRSDNPGGAITSDGDHVWATDTNFYGYRGWVAELSTRSGGLARVIGAKSGHVERS